MKNIFQCTLFLIVFLVGLTNAIASPQSLTYQGRIIKADGTPLEYSQVQFAFKIMDPTGQYVIFEELSGFVDMSGSKGVFDVPIGSGTKVFPDANIQALDAAYVLNFTLLSAFNNSTPFYCKGSANPNCYVPVADDGRVLRVQFWDGVGWKQISPDSVIRSVPFAGFASSAAKLGTYTANDFLLKVGLPTCAAGTFLSWDGSALSCSGISGANGGTVTSVTSANAYISVANTTTTPVVTLNVGTAANTVAAGNDARFSDARTPTGAAAGDLSGTYPNPGVAKIRGATVSATAPTVTGQTLRYDATASEWVPAKLATADITGLSTSLSNVPTYSQFAICDADETLTFVSPAGGFICTAISLDGSGIKNTAALTVASVTASTLNGTDVYSDSLYIRSPSGSPTNTIKITGPTTAIGASYTLKLPQALPGANGQILSGDTSGNLSWVSSTGVAINSLTGDVSASGTGSVTATVNSVGGSTAANINAATVLANAATNANTASAIVKRDASGNFAAGSASLGSAVLRDSGSNTVTLQAPTTVSTSYSVKFPTAQGSANQFMINDGSGNLSWTSLSSIGGQTTTLNNGQIRIGNASNVATAVTPAGDVTISNTGATLVGKIQNTGVVSTAPTATNNFFKFNGTNWAPGYINITDIRSTAAGNAQFFPTNCTAAQTLTWVSGTDNYICTNIAVSSSAVSFGTPAANLFFASPNGSSGAPAFRSLASADLPKTGADGAFVNGGNSFGVAASLGTNDNNTFTLKTNNTARMTVDGSGYFGLGTTSPYVRLNLQGSNYNESSAGFERNEENAAGAGLQFIKSRGTTSSKAAVASGDILGNVIYSGYATSSALGTAAIVSAVPAAAWTGTSAPGDLVFQTNSGTGAITSTSERMRLSSEGYLGLNTDDPIVALDIVNNNAGDLYDDVNIRTFSASATPAVLFKRARGTLDAPTAIQANDNIGGLLLSGHNGTGLATGATIRAYADPSAAWSVGATPAHIRFETNNGTTIAERVRIASSGYVGINDSTPSYHLDVAGTIRGTTLINGSFDFILGNNDQTSRGNSGSSRALVKNAGNILIVNYGNDFTGGIMTGSMLRPETDGTFSLGDSTHRWSAVYSSNGTIQTSDGRLKTEIKEIPQGLNFITSLEPVSYKWKKEKDNADAKTHWGFIAQDLEKKIKRTTAAEKPAAIVKESEYYGVNYSELIAPIVKSIKELYALVIKGQQADDQRLKALELENQKVKAENEALKARLDNHEKQLEEIRKKLSSK
ncbi:tail fiber domain-containing protein [Bdellovibrio bacteriovorus]